MRLSAVLVGEALCLAVVAGVLAAVVGLGLPPFDDQPPRGVAPATEQRQDGLVDDVQLAAGGSWGPVRSRIVACRDADDYKGWSRTVEVSRDDARTDDATTAERILPVLDANGFTDTFVGEADDGLAIDARAEDRRGRAELDIGDERLELRVVGSCDVPGR